MELLSWIFTESLIRNCFEISEKATDTTGCAVACELINEMCGVNVDDVSCDEDQCECLIGAITVCIFSHYVSVLCSYFVCVLCYHNVFV